MSETIKVHFSIEGEFITNLARETFYQNHDLGKAIQLLMDCLMSDDLTEEDRFMIALKIINGNAELVGTYPNDDYGVRDIENKDTEFDIVTEINQITSRMLQLEEQVQNNVQKFLFVLDYLDLSENTLRQMNNAYGRMYDEYLFPQLNNSSYTNETLQALNKFNYNNPVESYIKRAKDARDDDYGWLAPDGTYYPVEWGEHSAWAVKYADEHYPFKDHANMYWMTDSNNKRRHLVGGDFLVYRLHWVLLDSPHQGIAKPQYDHTHGLTKAQREFLYDYYIDRNLTDEANALYQDE